VRDLERYVAEAQESLYFSGARIDEHLVAFLDEQRDACIQLGKSTAGRMPLR
jgi:hypothetical protein